MQLQHDAVGTSNLNAANVVLILTNALILSAVQICHMVLYSNERRDDQKVEGKNESGEQRPACVLLWRYHSD